MVFKARVNGVTRWHIDVPDRVESICTERDTWQEAMDLALAAVGLGVGQVDRMHEHCTACDRLAREAVLTALAVGTDHWTSIDIDRAGRTHCAHYLAEASAELSNPEPLEAP